MLIQCVHCDQSTTLTEDGARVAGWRIFRGTSQTGAPLTDSLCPTCSGRTGPKPLPDNMPQDSLLDLLLPNKET